MGIGSIKGIENISGRPIGGAQPVDSASKNIQKEISEVQRQKQNLSSKNDLPAAEKEKERQKLQQKMSGLNRELRQRQAQNRNGQQRKALADESRTDIFGTKDAKDKNIKASNATAKDDAEKDTEINSTKTTEAGRTDIQNNEAHNMARRAGVPGKNADGKTAQDKALGTQVKASGNKDAQDKASPLQDFEIPQKEWKAVAMSDSSKEQMRKQEAVIARIEGGIAILKSEIRLDEARGEDVTKKQAELDKQEAKLQQTSAAFSSPGQFNQAAKRTASAKPGEATNFSKEKEPAEQQPLFHV